MKKLIGIIGIVVAILFIANFTSCNATQTVAENTSNTAQVATGAQVWSSNCIRCHNMPSPSAYNDNEWTAIVNHMQKVAGLTVNEADSVAAFMKSAN